MAASAADISVPRLDGPLILDGRREEPQWRVAARLQYTEFTRWIADTYEIDPSAFQFRFFHDGRTLYVALVSYDRYIESDSAPENSDGLYSLSIQTRAGEIMHYRLRWAANPPVAGGDMLESAKWGARLRGPFQDAAHPGGGYIFEIAIPLSAIGWEPGDTVPVNIIVNDHDGGPGMSFRTQGVNFARFAWGSFENEDRVHYRTLMLAR